MAASRNRSVRRLPFGWDSHHGHVARVEQLEDRCLLSAGAQDDYHSVSPEWFAAPMIEAAKSVFACAAVGRDSDTIGFDPQHSVFMLRNSLTTGAADITFGYGAADAGWRPLVGAWQTTGPAAGAVQPASAVAPQPEPTAVDQVDLAGLVDQELGSAPAAIDLEDAALDLLRSKIDSAWATDLVLAGA